MEGDKSVDISANIVTITPREQEQTVMLFDDVQCSGTNIKTQDNLSYFLNQTKTINKEQLLVNRPQFYNYVNINHYFLKSTTILKYISYEQ